MSSASFVVAAGALSVPPGGTSNFDVEMDGYQDGVDSPSTFDKVPWANNGVVTMAGKLVNTYTLRLYFSSLADWVTLKKNTGYMGTLSFVDYTGSAWLRNADSDEGHASGVLSATCEFIVEGS